MNKQDRNIRTWKNKEGNLCFSYDMQDSMENPAIVIIILLVFIGIILFEYLYFNSYYSLIILPFLYSIIFVYWTFYPLKYNEKIEEYMMDKNVTLRLHNDVRKLGKDIYEKRRKFYKETKGTYGVVIGTYMLVLLSNNDILEYELKFHTSKDNQKSTYCEFIKTPQKCLNSNRRKVIEIKTFINRMSSTKITERAKLLIIIFGILIIGLLMIFLGSFLYAKLGITKCIYFFIIYLVTYLLFKGIIHYKKNKILTIIDNILSFPYLLIVVIEPTIHYPL